MRCPVCGGDKLWLGYHMNKRYFHCYNHGSGKKWELFRAWFPSEDIRALLSQIDSGIVAPLPAETEKKGRYLPPRNPVSLDNAPKYYCDYIRSRGLDPQVLSDKWGVMAIDWEGEFRYRGRLLFPVRNADGVPASWLTRTICSDITPRYLTAPPEREAEPIKSLLYGEQFISPFETIIVCEGVFDALRIGRNAVATFGKSLTKAQMRRVAQYQRRIICFDSEPDTQCQAVALAKNLSVFPGLTDNVCLDAPDPATASQDEINALLRAAELL